MMSQAHWKPGLFLENESVTSIMQSQKVILHGEGIHTQQTLGSIWIRSAAPTISGCQDLASSHLAILITCKKS